MYLFTYGTSSLPALDLFVFNLSHVKQFQKQEEIVYEVKFEKLMHDNVMNQLLTFFPAKTTVWVFDIDNSPLIGRFDHGLLFTNEAHLNCIFHCILPDDHVAESLPVRCRQQVSMHLNLTMLTTYISVANETLFQTVYFNEDTGVYTPANIDVNKIVQYNDCLYKNRQVLNAFKIRLVGKHVYQRKMFSLTLTECSATINNHSIPYTGNDAFMLFVLFLKQHQGEHCFVDSKFESALAVLTDVFIEKTSCGLKVGDHVAYFLPNVPVHMQTRFITTEIIGIDFKKPCFLKFKNGYHKHCVDGILQLAKFNPDTNRIIFPVKQLVSWLHKTS